MLLLSTLCCVFVITSIIFFAGLIFSRLIIKMEDNFYFRAGAGFFLSAASWLFLWTIGAKITGALAALYILLTLLIVLLIIQRKFLFETLRQETGKLKKIVYLLLIVTLVIIVKSLSPIPDYPAADPTLINPFAGFGSVVHSFRAGNLTSFIVEHDRFPLINQHSGQSIWASIPLFFGLPAAQLSLVLWLAVFLTFFIVLLYGAVKKYWPTLPVWLPVTIVLLGNTVLSPFYSSITDTESALLLSSNSDSLFSIATIFLSLIFLYEAIRAEKTNWGCLITFFLFSFVWNETGGEMIVLFAMCLIVALGQFGRAGIRRIALIGTILLVGAASGIAVAGGMLSPDSRNENISLPGLMTVKQAGQPVLSLRFPRTGEGNPQTLAVLKEMFAPQDTVAPSGETAQNMAATVKQNSLVFDLARVVRSVQLVFFPLLGLLLAYWLKKDRSDFWRFFRFQTLFLFLIGWGASTLFALYGYYWELSKFFYAGAFTAMLLLGLCLAELWQTELSKNRRRLLSSLIIFIVLGPALQFLVVDLAGNFVRPRGLEPALGPAGQKCLGPISRLKALTTMNEIVGQIEK